MNYFSVISLSEAKLYLRVSDTSSDKEIERMIKSSLSYLEKHTNHILCTRDITYYYYNGCVRVYDYPINSAVTTSETRSVEVFPLYSTYTESNTETKTLTLNVGYSDPGKVPWELREAALEMIDYWYYKNDGKANIALIPHSVQAVIQTNKRYVL